MNLNFKTIKIPDLTLNLMPENYSYYKQNDVALECMASIF